jgi:hypothetical protein
LYLGPDEVRGRSNTLWSERSWESRVAAFFSLLHRPDSCVVTRPNRKVGQGRRFVTIPEE